MQETVWLILQKAMEVLLDRKNSFKFEWEIG